MHKTHNSLWKQAMMFVREWKKYVERTERAMIRVMCCTKLMKKKSSFVLSERSVKEEIGCLAKNRGQLPFECSMPVYKWFMHLKAFFEFLQRKWQAHWKAIRLPLIKDKQKIKKLASCLYNITWYVMVSQLVCHFWNPFRGLLIHGQQQEEGDWPKCMWKSKLMKKWRSD